MTSKNDYSNLHDCPSCGAKQGKPCRTPAGRKSTTIHNTRPFSIPAVPVAVLAVSVSSKKRITAKMVIDALFAERTRQAATIVSASYLPQIQRQHDNMFIVHGMFDLGNVADQIDDLLNCNEESRNADQD